MSGAIYRTAMLKFPNEVYKCLNGFSPDTINHVLTASKHRYSSRHYNLLVTDRAIKFHWALFMDGVQLPQGYSHFEEAVYFL